MIADGARGAPAPLPDHTAMRLIGSRGVIADGRGATDRESISSISLRQRAWIPS
jgi:hypothetical protein